MINEPELGSDRPEPNPDPGPNRLLFVLVSILGIAALSLLVLLVWLLWPKSETGDESQAAAGYPIVAVRSILGYGNSAAESLLTPLGVAFDPDGNVWVADTGNSRVLVFTQDGNLIRTLGEAPEDPGNVVAPYGIAFDPDTNRAYVADFAQYNIRVYDIDSGAYLTTFPNPKQEKKVFGTDMPFVPFDVQVVDGRIAASSSDGIWFFDQDGFVVGHWGEKVPGSKPGEYNFADAMTVDDATGQLVVADSLNKRVVALDHSGEVQWISGSADVEGSSQGYWQLPRGIAIGPECNIYVVDTFRPTTTGVGDGFFQVLQPDGKLLSGFGADGDAENFLSFPDHLDYYGPDDLWAIADREHNRVLLFRLTPLPAPDQSSREGYPKSFHKGPFPAIAKPDPGLNLAEGSTTSCPGPVATSSPFPWWILLVILFLIILYLAIRRLRKNRRQRLEREAASAQLLSGTPGETASGAQVGPSPGAGTEPPPGPPEGT